MEEDKEPQTNPELNSNVSVLLVDDNKVNQFLGKKILRNLGILNVEVASDGFAALEMLKSKKYDVLLTDVEMPGMTGYELTSILREKEKNNITIIALTANATDAEREVALKHGMNDYIAKPYSPADLLHVLRKHVIDKNTFVLGDASSVSHQDLGPVQSLYLLFNGNKTDVKNLLLLLHFQLPEGISELKKSILNEDWDKVFHCSHKLKSTIKLFNDKELFCTISNLNEYAKNNANHSAIPSLFDDLQVKIEGIMMLINNELESL